MSLRVRPMSARDWPAVASIYREGIETGEATFETRVPRRQEWEAARMPCCRLIAEREGRVEGFAALSPVSSRPVYAGVGEVMVYVTAPARGRGTGRALLDALVRASEAAGVWTLQAGIFPENEPSLAIHRRAGFREVGTRERIGRFHDGRWRDVVLLERRSTHAGID